MATTRIALVSALTGDLVPGHELADPGCPTIPGLEDRSDVKDFFAANNYGEDADEVMYLVSEDDFEEIPEGFDRLIIPVCDGPTLAQLAQELGAQPYEVETFAGPTWGEMAECLGLDPREIGMHTELPAESVAEIREAWAIASGDAS